MNYADLDTNLSEEDRAVRDMTRRFALEVMRPAGIALDKLDDPADVIAEGSELWDVHRAYRELGLHKRGIPEHLGGLGPDGFSLNARAIMTEELGYGDGGLAISLGVQAFPFYYAGMSPHKDVQEWARDYAHDEKGEIIGCWAITEPDHGSDWTVAGEEWARNPKMAPSLRAVKRGNEYVLNGQKSAWVSNGTIATHAFLHVCLEQDKGMQGTGVCILPLDLPGVSKGKPLDKMGQRALNQGEIFFEEVVIPEHYMIVPDVRMGTEIVGAHIWTAANTSMGLTFAGLARSALDEGLHYAQERIQGGEPIIRHQNVRLKLMRMFTAVEAARALSRQAQAINAANPPGSLPHGVACKALATETAFQVASEALQIHGGNGLTREYLIEKILRDARTSMIEDGTNETLMIRAAHFL